jgi:hypothetical protein
VTLRAEKVRPVDLIEAGSTASTTWNEKPAWAVEGCTNGECIDGMDSQQS